MIQCQCLICDAAFERAQEPNEHVEGNSAARPLPGICPQCEEVAAPGRGTR